ncbi:MAG: phosphate ABC transporter permease PstA [Holophagales bacterium]|nr:phosphate ABC transporter permease PstA [Holophagales bacterium]
MSSATPPLASARKAGLFRSGEPFIWITGSGLAAAVLMVAGLLWLILANGLGFFWPAEVSQYALSDGRTVAGPLAARERVPDPGATAGTPPRWRIKVKQGNRDVTGEDFVWIDESAIRSTSKPADVIAFERREWGAFYGWVKEVRDGGNVVASGRDASWKALGALLPKALDVYEEALTLEKDRIGAVNFEKDKLRLARKKLERKGVSSGPDVEALAAKESKLQAEYDRLLTELQAVRSRVTAVLVLETAGGQEKELPLVQVVRADRPNEMGWFTKAGRYAANVWAFVSEDPRESNTEGGVFPAIFGTVLMVLIMSIVVTPLGVLTAFYLREYAKQGPVVSAVRIAVNNLAGVPSIVYGVFGLGFFIYFLGGSIDRLFFSEALPTPTWGTGGILWASLTLSLLTVPVVIVSAEEGLAAIPRGMREASLALGATKFETMWRVVLPAVMPSILTGLILAMARAAGEVAPLMITGVVKLAPALPIDGFAPFMHLDRKFMHLGFHIYDVGFQSPNVDAARPMVFTTTILLIVLVVALNLTAIVIRGRLRKKLRSSGI